jgi:hypothetical protein
MIGPQQKAIMREASIAPGSCGELKTNATIRAINIEPAEGKRT